MTKPPRQVAPPKTALLRNALVDKHKRSLPRNILRELLAEQREATAHIRGFDAAESGEVVDRLTKEQAERHGVASETLSSLLMIEVVKSGRESFNAEKKHEEERLRAARPDQRARLRRRLDQIDEEHGYRARVAAVRNLHEFTRQHVDDFLAPQPLGPPVPSRPVAMRRARRFAQREKSRGSASDDEDGSDGAVIPFPQRRPALYRFACLKAHERGEGLALEELLELDAEFDWEGLRRECDARNERDQTAT